jgi:hypothetical protein
MPPGATARDAAAWRLSGHRPIARPPTYQIQGLEPLAAQQLDSCGRLVGQKRKRPVELAARGAVKVTKKVTKAIEPGQYHASIVPVNRPSPRHPRQKLSSPRIVVERVCMGSIFRSSTAS